jgi:hypothetical protein
MPVRDPQYGVELTADELTASDPSAVLYGITPNNTFIPIKIDTSGRLELGTGVTLTMSDIQIGAVELKNYNTDDRVFVSTGHELLTTARLYDASGLEITSTTVGLKQGIDVNVVGGGYGRLTDTEDDSVAAGQSSIPLSISFLYGYDGVDWQRVNSTSGRLLVDGSGVTQPISGTVSVSNSSLAVTQSGTWSTGRTWTLSSGTDSVSVVQSGTWNLNNISGTVSLPTGAATETTLSSLNSKDFATQTTLALIKAKTDNLDVLLSTRTKSSDIQTIAGTITANAGTNLNTSALALETTLSSVKTQTDKLTFTSSRLLVDGSGVTQPISAVSLPLPTGASTLSEQQTQTTSLQLIDDLSLGQGSTTSGQKGVLNLGAVTSTAPTYTTTQTSSLSLDTSGNLRVKVSADTSSSSSPTAGTISDYVSANKVYVTAFNVNMPSAGTDNPLLLVRNPTGSGKILYVYKLGFGSTVANVSAIFKVFANPTVTANGTSQAAVSLNIGGGAPVASMLSTSTPTVTAAGSEIESYEAGSNNNSGSFVEDFSIHVAANNSLLITGNPASNNRDAALTIVWVEV